MERRQQERLVGAIVVVIAATVVVPWLLDGSPERWAAEGSARPVLEQPRLQRRTLDLRNPDAAPVEAQPTPTRQTPAPSPRPVVSLPPQTPGQNVAEQQVEPAPQRAVQTPTPAVEDDDSEEDGATASAPVSSAPAPASPTEPVQAAVVTAPPPAEEPAPAGVETGWAVQVGSFRQRDNAQGLVDKLSRQGYRAFLSRHTRSGVVWYRVRVGTEQTRAAAGDVAARLRREGEVTAVVRHP